MSIDVSEMETVSVRTDDAPGVVRDAIRRLRDTYTDHHFVAERDVVWTLQRYMGEQLVRTHSDLRVFNDFGMGMLGEPKQTSDLVLVDSDNVVLAAVEVEYEPSHDRADKDIWPTKFPVVFWEEVVQDAQRVEAFVHRGRAEWACSLLVDEGGHFRSQPAPRGAEWQQWDHGVWALVRECCR